MSLTNRALWIIERNLGRDLSLADLASACGVSRHHLAHAFGEAAGLSVIAYVRRRRLSEAAQALAAGADNILQLGLASGYGSHEAFSRAFKAQLGTTPEAVRRAGSTDGLDLQPRIVAADHTPLRLRAPEIRAERQILAVGLCATHAFGAVSTIPAQWRSFGPMLSSIPNCVGAIPLGVMMSPDEAGAFAYACAVEVSGFGDVPAGLSRLTLPARRYAVFRHAGHVSTIRTAYSAIWNDWSPPAEWRVAEAPSLERHDRAFDPASGEGGLEIWIPLEPA